MTTKPCDSVTEFAKRIADKGVFDGGPAYPFLYEDDGAVVAHTGMSLRDYFAAKAMDTLLHSSKVASGFGYMEPDDVARRAYEIADAMLDAREKVSGR